MAAKLHWKLFSRISLSSMILLSMVAGILTGLFFGELVGFLDVIGDIWIKLLQMTVLPYVMLSLILGLGRLNYRDALLLAKKGGSMLLLLWLVTLAVVFLFPYVFPDWDASSVFAALDAPKSESVDFIDLYIPSNPFHALANNLVPAVVLFSIALGVALIGVPNKEKALDGMGLLIDTLVRIANFVVKLTPLGVFAIMASAAGTMSFAEFQRLEIYIYSYIAVSLVMSLWILPGLVIMLTPLSYREVVGSTKDALITAFATTSLFVVLPILMEKSKEMVARHTGDQEKADSAVEVIIPASFNFPHAGKLFTLTFVLFAGWHSGYPLDVSDYPRLMAAGVASLFANVNLAIPFILDAMRMPGDLYQLFVATGVINARFATLLATMFTLSLTLLGAFSMSGGIRLRWKAMFRYLFISVLLLLLSIPGLRMVMEHYMENSYMEDQVVAGRDFYDVAVTGQVYREVYREPPAALPVTQQGNRLQDIVDRGVLRACYAKDDIPFSYFNSSGRLVGLDVELFHYLADDLGVRVEFVPSTWVNIIGLLNSGYCDLGTGRTMTPQSAYQGAFTIPIMDRSFASLVEDYRRSEFVSFSKARTEPGLRLALTSNAYVERMVKKLLPNAELVIVDSLEDVIAEQLEAVKRGESAADGEQRIDAMVTTAEKAAAWSLLYPRYSPVVPTPVVHLPAAFPIPHDEEDLADYMKIWLTIRKKDGSIQSLYDYWVLGKKEHINSHRWSVIRDVLHWVD